MPVEIRMATVGPVQENCFLVRASAQAPELLVVDPGDEADRLLAAIEDTGATVAAILLTHTHFDHVGAVAPLARATGAPVYCPEGEAFVLRDLPTYTPPYPGIGPFESWEPEKTVDGGERLELAGLELDVLFLPGHSPGHVAYSLPSSGVVFSGDVLFEGSIGRTDLPGGDHAELLRSIAKLLDALPGETQVCPGHMGPTTLDRELASNPFLQELAR